MSAKLCYIFSPITTVLSVGPACSEGKSIVSEKFDEEMLRRAAVMFDWSKEKNVEEKERKMKGCVENVKALVNHRHLVRIKSKYVLILYYCRHVI